MATDFIPRWHSNIDVFFLKLASELVFAGDAGTTEPSGSTTRTGIEWSNAYKFNNWLNADFNAAFSRARFDQNVNADDTGCGDAAIGFACTQVPAIIGRYIPNSPTSVIDAGLTAQHPSGWFNSIRARHFGDSPLVEDDSAKSPAYTTFDLQLGYQQSRCWLVALDVFNLFDKRWNDIEYYYASRLKGEAAARPDYVIHPGVPLTVRAHFEYFL